MKESYYYDSDWPIVKRVEELYKRYVLPKDELKLKDEELTKKINELKKERQKIRYRLTIKGQNWVFDKLKAIGAAKKC